MIGKGAKKLTKVKKPTKAWSPPETTPTKKPYMAVKMTTKGQPWYGAGVQGWIRRTFGETFDPEKFFGMRDTMTSTAEKALATKVSGQVQKKYRKLGAIWDTNMTWTGVKFSDLADISGSFAVVSEEAKTEAEKAGKKYTPLRAGATGFQLAGQVAKNWLSPTNLINVVAYPLGLGEDLLIRKAIVAPTIVALQDWKAKGKPLISKLPAGTEMWKEKLDEKQLEVFQKGSWAAYTNLANEIGLLPVLEKIPEAKKIIKEAGIKAWVPGSKEWFDVIDKITAVRANLDKSLGAARNDEFVRRATNGEDPDFLALEYQNPWIELAGSLVLDPLNLVGVGAVERGTKIYSQAQEFAQAAPEVSQALKLVTQHVDDAVHATANIREAARAAHAFAVGTDMKLAKYSTLFSPLVLTSTGKQDVAFKTANNILGWVTGHSASMEDLRDTLAALTRLADPNPEVYEDAFMVLAHRGDMVNGLFSPAGFETGAMLKRLIGNGAWIDNLMEIGTPAMKQEALLDYIEKSSRIIAKEFYPSIDEMEEGFQAVKKLGEAATEKQIRLATMYQGLGDGMKRLNKIHNFAQKKLFVFTGIQGVNEFFARVYMGYSFGYAARNLQNNLLTILFDQGFEAAGGALRSGLESLWDKGGRVKFLTDDMEDFLGFRVSEVLGKGKQPVSALGVEGKGLSRGFAINISQGVEHGMRTSVVHSVAQRSINKFLDTGAYLPDMTKFLDEGIISTGDIDTFKILMKQFRGNTDKAIEAMKLMDKDGFVKVWQLVQPQARLFNYFSDTGMLRSMMQAARADTPEEFLRLSDEIIEQVVGRANRLASEEPAQFSKEMSEEVATFMADVEDAVKAGWENDVAGQYLQSRRVLIGQAYEKAVSDFNTLGRNISAQLSDSTMANQVAEGIKVKPAMQVADNSGNFSHFTWEIRKKITDSADLNAVWKNTKFKLGSKYVSLGKPPKILTPQTFKEALWKWYRDSLSDFWTDYFGGRIEEYKKATALLCENTGVAVPSFADIDALVKRSEEFQDAYLYMKSGPLKDLANLPPGTTLDELDTLTELVAGEYSKPRLFNMVNKDRRLAGLAEALTPKEILMDEVIRAIESRKLKGLMPDAEYPVTLQRATAKSWEKIEPMFRKWQDDVVSSWGQTRTVFSSGKKNKVYRELRNMVENRMATARMVAAAEGSGAADFALLSYNKTGLDVVMQYIYPYEYWYRGTYPNWAKRMVNNPVILADYVKYRRFLENLHAGLPEWYKYQLNTGDFGIDTENPLYFNLESTINPINGMTGVDFNDPYKRVDMLTRMVDDLGKLGPTTWTPYNYAIAAYLGVKYEQTQDEKFLEASKRWLGRLFPQTATIKTGLAGIQELATQALKENPDSRLLQAMSKPLGKYNEFDPFVSVAMGGLDPYELRRVNRELAYMVETGEITEEQQIDAAWLHEGDVWDRAVAMSLSRRALPNLASFFLGTGYKPRTKADMQIDEAYANWTNIKAIRDSTSPEKYRELMQEHFVQYPWFEGLLIGGRGTEDRQTAYVYNVLSRIPPGRSDDAMAVFGLTTEMVNSFYENKGFKGFTPADKDRFMATISDLGALLALPDDATEAEWDAAGQAYSDMLDYQAQVFGREMDSILQGYYDAENKTKYVSENPSVMDAMLWRNDQIMNNPIIYKYYGTLSNVYYRYDWERQKLITEKYGDGIFVMWDYYKRSGIPKKEWSQEVKDAEEEYYAYGDEITKLIVAFGRKIPQNPVYIKTRPGSKTPSQQAILAGMQTQQYRTASQYLSMMPEPLRNIVLNYLNTGEEIPGSAWSSLAYIAESEGMNANQLMQIIEIDYGK